MNEPLFYGVSVGPGDPELMTLQAVRILNKCSVILAPQTASGATVALDIARGAVDLIGKEIIYLPVPMTRDPEKLKEAHKKGAELALNALRRGKDAAMLTLGDVSVYSTVHYLKPYIEQAGFACRMIAGVPSFCEIAARLGQSLTKMNEPLHIYPAGVTELPRILQADGTKILMKSGKKLPEVAHALQDAAEADSCSLAINCGLPGEKLLPDLKDYNEEEGYFATFLIR